MLREKNIFKERLNRSKKCFIDDKTESGILVTWNGWCFDFDREGKHERFLFETLSRNTKNVICDNFFNKVNMMCLQIIEFI